jgi:hypothetical protein
MSTPLAIGAVGALAALALASGQGSRDVAAGGGLATPSPARRRELDAMAARYRRRLQGAEAWGRPGTELSRHWAAQERRERGYAIEYLGHGRDRSVFRIPEGALKLEHHEGLGRFNLLEVDFWRRAPVQIQPYLVPVLDAAEDGSWLLMEEVEVAPHSSRLPRDVELGLKACGVGDYSKGTNLSVDGRIVDYSFVRSQADRERCLRGGVDISALLSPDERRRRPGWRGIRQAPPRPRGEAAGQTFDPQRFMDPLGQTAPLPPTGSAGRGQLRAGSAATEPFAWDRARVLVKHGARVVPGGNIPGARRPRSNSRKWVLVGELPMHEVKQMISDDRFDFYGGEVDDPDRKREAWLDAKGRWGDGPKGREGQIAFLDSQYPPWEGPMQIRSLARHPSIVLALTILGSRWDDPAPVAAYMDVTRHIKRVIGGRAKLSAEMREVLGSVPILSAFPG